MPKVWRRQYLLRKSGGDGRTTVFNLSKHLKKHNKILLIWPENQEEALIAYSAVKNLREAESPDISWAHWVEGESAELIAGLFPEEPMVKWHRKESAWHDADLQASVASLRDFAPETVVNLMRPCPPVLQAVMNATGAEMRICIDERCLWPYANVRLQQSSKETLAGRFFQILSPWRYSGFTPQEHWERIHSGAGQQASASEKWRGASAVPETTWIYLHDVENPNRPLDDALHALLIQRLKNRDGGEYALGVAAWNPSRAPWERTGAWSGATFLEACNLSELLGILESSRGVAAGHGFGLQFAGLTEARVMALLRKEEAVYDVSAWNPLFQVEWV